MLKVYELYSEKEVAARTKTTTRFASPPRDRRGRRRNQGQGQGQERGNRGTGTPVDRSNRETELATRGSRSLRVNLVSNNSRNTGVIVLSRDIVGFVLRKYFGYIYKCASSVMGMFKWLRK